MVEKVLVPVDGSSFAEHALPHAIGIVRRNNAELHLLLAHHVTLGVEAGWMPQPELFAKNVFDSETKYIEDLKRRLEEAGVERVSVHHDPGEPAERVTQFATDQGVDLIVMSTHGRGGLQRTYLGSVADGVVRRSNVPVLLVRPDEDEAARPFTPAEVRASLVAVDGSDESEAALDFALRAAAIQGARCTVIRVITPPLLVSAYVPDTPRLTREQLDAAGQRAQEYLDGLGQARPGIDGTRVVVHQQPAIAILNTAVEIDADLIAVGTRGRGKIARFFIGSVADKVVRGAHVPVLVVPGQD